MNLLASTSELWTLVLNHRTHQILYIDDISLVVAYLELVAGYVVLEFEMSLTNFVLSCAGSIQSSWEFLLGLVNPPLLRSLHI